MQDKTYEIAMIGDEGSIAGFRGLGLKVFPVDPDTNHEEKLQELIDLDEYAIIYVSDEVARNAQRVIDEYNSSFLPAIITLPAPDVKDSAGVDSLKDMVIRAIGVDLVTPMLVDNDEFEDDDEDEYND